MALIAALDIGGTKVAAGVVDSQGGIRVRLQRPTRATGSPEGLLADTCDLLADVLDRSPPVAGLGVACAGPMSERGVSPVNIPAWRDFPLQERLGERFRERIPGPVTVDNDVKAMAMGERWVGAARGEDDFLAMVVSTGIGGGIVLDGRPLDGRLGNAGHVGHIAVVPGGAVCGCGARGCLEAEASGTAISREAVKTCQAGDGGPVLQRMWEQTHVPPEPNRATSGGTGFGAAHVAAAAREGDEAAALILARAGRLIGRAIAEVATLLDLRLAVIGGGVALAGGFLLDPMADEARRSAQLSYARNIEVRAAALAADAGIVGAAADWSWRVRGEHPGVGA